MAAGPVLTNMARAWHWIVLRGVFAVLFGIFAFIWPGITLAALVLVWGAYAIADGVMALIAAFTMHEGANRWRRSSLSVSSALPPAS